MVKRINNHSYQYPSGDKEIIAKISNPNYEVGNYILPANASVADKFKYEICQTILTYQQQSKISYEELARRIDLSFARAMNILKGRINDFDLDELVSCLEKLTIPCQVRIIPEVRRKSPVSPRS
jgi:predicted XRE-type DNA-binding protein